MVDFYAKDRDNLKSSNAIGKLKVGKLRLQNNQMILGLSMVQTREKIIFESCRSTESLRAYLRLLKTKKSLY